MVNKISECDTELSIRGASNIGHLCNWLEDPGVESGCCL